MAGIGAFPASFGQIAAAGTASAGALSPAAVASILGAGMHASPDASGNAGGGSPFPVHPAFAPPAKAGGGGILDALKNFGSTALKVVNTPFDTAETLGSWGTSAAANALHSTTGIGHNWSYIPTHDLYASFHGSSPGTDTLKAAGVTSPGLLKWGGLALDLGTAIGVSFIDPMGLAKVAGEAGKVGEVASKAGLVSGLTGGGSASASKVADFATKAQDIFKSAVKADPSASKDLAKITEYAAHTVKQPAAKLAIESGQKLLPGRRAIESGIPAGQKLIGDGKSLSKVAEYVAHNAPRSIGGSTQGELVHVVPGLLGKAARMSFAAAKAPRLSEGIKAFNSARRVVPEAARSTATAETLTGDAAKIKNLFGGSQNYAETYAKTAADRTARMIEHAQPGKIGVRLGPKWLLKAGENGVRDVPRFGKLAPKIIPTALPWPTKSLALGSKGLNSFNGFFRRPAAQIAARNIGISSSSAQEHIAHMADEIAKQLGTTPEDSFRMGTHMHMGLIDKGLAHDFKTELIKNGLWTDRMTHLENKIQSDFQAMSKAAGFGSTEEHAQWLLEQSTNPALSAAQQDVHTAELIRMGRMGPYAPTQVRKAVMNKLSEMNKEARKTGGAKINMASIKGANPEMAKTYQSAFHTMTPEMWTKAATEQGGLSPELAQSFIPKIEQAGKIQETRDAAGHIVAEHNPQAPGVFRDTPIAMGDTGLNYEPELDAMNMWVGRNQAHISIQMDKSIEKLIDHMGPVPLTQRALIKERLTTETNLRNVPGTIASSRFGQEAQTWTRYLKMQMTTNNPGHFIKVGTQDYMNSWVNGNWRHFIAGPMINPVSHWSKFARGTLPEMYSKTYEIAGKTWTGAELAYAAHAMGLGFMHGAAGEEIQIVGEMLNVGQKASKNPFTRWARGGKALNINRDNAQRIRTFVNHMRGGDDPITAGIKTVRTNLDYGAMTNIEKNFMRNAFLFYSWFRKNGELHLGGLMTRPGLYAGTNIMERDRPKQLGEPGYYPGLGLIPIPGMNAQLGFGNPIIDALSRDNFTSAGLRENTLGMITPFARIPAEHILNTDLSSGRKIQNVPGQAVPSFIGNILQGLGLPGSTMTSKSAYGVPVPGIDAKLNHDISLLFPPTAPGISGDLQPGGAGGLSALGRFLGIRPYVADPMSSIAALNNQAWASNSNAKTLLKHGQLP